MPETPARLTGRLLEEGERSAAFFRGLEPGALEAQIYTDGTCWRVRDILAHFVTAEISLRRLVDNILSGGDGSPADFDLDRYNERKLEALKNTEPAELLEQYLFARKETAALVGSMRVEDLAKEGRHPYLGIAPLVDIIKIIYRHNSIHIREIRHALAAQAGGKGQEV